jgi:hypothetical protein
MRIGQMGQGECRHHTLPIGLPARNSRRTVTS